MDADLLQSVAEAIRSVSKRTQTMVIQADSLLVEDLSLDSLDLVGVLMKLEDCFGLVIEVDDVPQTKTVGDLGDHIAKLRGGQASAA